MDRMILLYGEDEWWEAVHTVMADQEFMPTFYRNFYQSMSMPTKKKIPVILMLAMGHLWKSMVVSEQTYHQSIYDPVYEAQGIKVDSPRYKKLRKGRVIRDSLRWDVGNRESLRVALAHFYRQERGAKACIPLGPGRVASPVFVVETHCNMHIAQHDQGGSSYIGRSDERALQKEFALLPTEVCLDPHARPVTLKVTQPLLDAADDFESWVKGLGGCPIGGLEVGPSGFIRRAPSFAENNSSGSVEDPLDGDVEAEFEFIRTHPIYDPIEKDGIFDRCKALRIYDSELPRSSLVLRGRYYLYRKTLKETQSEEEARAAANKFVPGKRRALPGGLCLNGELIHRITMGVDAYAITEGILLSRVKCDANELRQNNCHRCSYGKKKCRCMSSYRFIVCLKACYMSVGTRKQQNYQKLLLYCLHSTAMVLDHEDDRVVEMTINRMIGVWTVNESGDSWVMIPADLCLEYRIVGTTKRYCNNINSEGQTTARVVLASHNICKEIEKKEPQLLSTLPPSSPKQKSIETRQYQVTVAYWRRSFVEDIFKESLESNFNNGIIIGSGGQLYADGCRYYFAPYDSLVFGRKACLAFNQGFRAGYGDMSMPHNDHRPLGRLHKLIGGGSGKSTNKKHLKAKQAKIRAKESEEIAGHTGYILAHPNHDIFADLSEAGKGKSSAHKAIFSLFASNEPFATRDGQIGDGPRPPIEASKNLSEAKEKMAQRSSVDAPTILVVDLLMLLQSLPPRRNNARDGGHFELNVREVARDIILMIYNKYSKYDDNLAMIVMCMDVNSTSSRIRLITRQNRGNAQKSNQTNYHSSERISSPTEPLSNIGEFSDLMRRDKDGFVVYLAEEIVNQLHSGRIIEEDWNPADKFRRVGIAFIGGSKDANVVFGNEKIRVSSTNEWVSRDSIDERTKHIVNQGEGERMIFTWLREFIAEAFDSCHGPLDCRFHIHCADSDALAGLSQYFVHSLSEYCKKNDSAKFTRSIILRCHNKSVSHVMSLPRKYQESLLGDIPANVIPTGNGFIWEIDCISLYESLEQHQKLQHLPAGHRAVAATAGMHSFVNNDYIATDGISHSEYLKALMSDQLVAVSSVHGADACSPIIIEPISFDASLEDKDNNSGINLSGAVLVIGAMVLGRKKMRNVLSRKYTPSQIKRFLVDKEYDLMLASSCISGDPTRAPDPLSIICQLSCVDFVLRQWIVCTYQRKISPAIGKNELGKTCYNIPEALAQGKSCSIDYDLLNHSRRLKRFCDGNSDAALRDALSRMRFGRIFSAAQLVPEAKPGKRWLFSPIDVCKLAINKDGIYPITRVKADDILSRYEADTYSKLKSLANHYWTLFTSPSSTPEDRDHGKRCLQIVYETTLCANTSYNERGYGSPLLVSNTPVDISESRRNGKRGRGISRWPEGCDDLASKEVKELLPLLWKEDGYKVYNLFDHLCKHLFEYRDGDLVAAVRAADRINELLDDDDDDDEEELDDASPYLDDEDNDEDADEDEEDEVENEGVDDTM